MSRHSNYNKKIALVAALGAIACEASFAQTAVSPPLPPMPTPSNTQAIGGALSLPAMKVEAAKAPQAPQAQPAPAAAAPQNAAASPQTNPVPVVPVTDVMGKQAGPVCKTVVNGACPESAEPAKLESSKTAAKGQESVKPVVKVEKKVVVVKKYVDVQNQEAEEQKFAAPSQDELAVSDRDFNHFIFPSAISQLLFPSGAPVVGTPVYMADNTQVLVQFKRGVDKPFQMIVETEAGGVYKMYLKSRPINGVTHKVADKSKPAPVAAKEQTKRRASNEPVAAGGADIELLRKIISGDTPSSFEPVDLPGITRFDKFTAIPLTGYSDGRKRVSIFTLAAVPGQSAVVAPPMFYRPGITAVLLDGDTVNAENSPQLYVVEDLSDE